MWQFSVAERSCRAEKISTESELQSAVTYTLRITGTSREYIDYKKSKEVDSLFVALWNPFGLQLQRCVITVNL